MASDLRIFSIWRSVAPSVKPTKPAGFRRALASLPYSTSLASAASWRRVLEFALGVHKLQGRAGGAVAKSTPHTAPKAVHRFMASPYYPHTPARRASEGEPDLAGAAGWYATASTV